VSHVADLAATLDALEIVRCHLVGASLGSGVAVELALTRPDLVGSLLLAPPGGSLLVELTQDLRDFIDAENAALDRDDLDAAVDANVSTWVVGTGRAEADVGPDVLERVRLMQRHAFEVQLAWGDVGEAELDPPAHERLGQVAVPTLVLVGGHDLATTKEAARRVSGSIAGSRLVEWPGVAHLPSMERPHDFSALLQEWIP
jgi:pimeloyl-ACP methyl ester carboxylesterase